MPPTILARRSRRTFPIAVAIIMLLRSFVLADSAQWSSTPGSSDWHTPKNWTPDHVPNSPVDTAIFGVSSMTSISVAAATQVNGLTFNAGGNAYTITAAEGAVLEISGVGLRNSSGATQSFISASQGTGQFGTIRFINTANPGDLAAFTTQSGTLVGIDAPAALEFFNATTAAGASVTNNGAFHDGVNGGETAFHDFSSAGSARFTNNPAALSSSTAGGGTVLFLDSSTAGGASFTNNPATLVAARGGSTNFADTSAAGTARITNKGAASINAGSGATIFSGNSSADHSTITNNGGVTQFVDSATAANATLIANSSDNTISGGQIAFFDDSTGAAAHVQVYGNGSLDISAHNAPGLTIGSLEGTGQVFLGSRNLSVGSNNMSGDFYGVIQEGPGRLTGGTLTKVGTLGLYLGGANTYPGMTTINSGDINVSGSLAGPVTINGGSLTGFGSVGPVTVNTGGKFSPGEDMGVMTVNGNLTMNSGSIYQAVLFGATAANYNQANVIGKVILTKSRLIVSLQYFPAVGDQYIIIKNDGSEAVKGKFNGLSEGAKFSVDRLHFKISYKGGDGNDIVLTKVR